MGSRCNSILLMFLLWCIAAPKLTHQLKNLVKVPSDVRVPECYFVHISHSASVGEMQALVDELRSLDANTSLPEFDAKGMFTITKLGFGFSAKLSDDALHYVRTVEIVSYIEEDEVFEGGELEGASSPSHPISWGLDITDGNFDGKFQPPCNLTGNGVDIYVVDTGIRYTHESFGGRVVYPGCDIMDDRHNQAQRGADCGAGHGTSVAGIVGGTRYGVAPGTTLFPIRVLNCDRNGTLTSLLRGLECMIEHHASRTGRPAVVNLSLFGRKSKLMKRAVDKIIESGVSVVALSGNIDYDKSSATWLTRDSCRVSPGSIHGVITVAGSKVDGVGSHAYEYAKMGICVDVFAPGHEVTTAINVPLCDNCERSLSGSSFAAPHVTGAIALLLEKCPSLPPWRVKHLLLTKMAVANYLNMNTIRRRYRSTTPNLFLQLNSRMCDIEC